MKKSTYTIGHIFRICHNVRIDIYKQHTECDRNKQKRLESLLDSKVKEYAGYCDHQVIAPCQIKECCLMNQVGQCFCYIRHLTTSRLSSLLLKYLRFLQRHLLQHQCLQWYRPEELLQGFPFSWIQE